MAGHFGGNPYKWDFPAQANNPHISRYMLARGFVFPWETVLDAACGTGYGSKLIALAAKKVIGYEVDEGCIASAKQHNPPNCEFSVMDLNTCELPDVDASINIETLEHLTPEGLEHFVDQLHKHVKRLIVISVPFGGSSFEYTKEVPGPATEKNDFITAGQLSVLIAPANSDWHEMTTMQFGLSHFCVYFKGQPLVPGEWEERVGFSKEEYEAEKI